MKRKTRIGSAFSLQLARALEMRRWELFSNRSGTSLDEGMVEKVAEFIRDWMDGRGFEVWYAKKTISPLAAWEKAGFPLYWKYALPTQIPEVAPRRKTWRERIRDFLRKDD